MLIYKIKQKWQGTPDEFHGTLLRHGTTGGNPWSNGISDVIKDEIYIVSSKSNMFFMIHNIFILLWNPLGRDKKNYVWLSSLYLKKSTYKFKFLFVRYKF